VTEQLRENDGAPEDAERNRWLWHAFARSVRANVMAEFVVQALRIRGIVVPARALSPHDFGLFKILVVVATFATLLNEAGSPDALIQRRDIRREHEWTAWWMSIGLALLTSSLVYSGAPGLEHLMKMPGLREGVCLLCILFLLEGAAVTANARLRRDLRFGASDCRRSRRDGFSPGRPLSALEAAAAMEPCRWSRGALCGSRDKRVDRGRKGAARSSDRRSGGET
jgi:hypothetical protein